jgi:hypothetical protein
LVPSVVAILRLCIYRDDALSRSLQAPRIMTIARQGALVTKFRFFQSHRPPLVQYVRC